MPPIWPELDALDGDKGDVGAKWTAAMGRADLMRTVAAALPLMRWMPMARIAIASGLARTILVSTLAIVPIAGHSNGSAATSNDRCGGIEYRLETTSDEPDSKDFFWWDGKITRRLSGHAFLNASDFRSATLRPSPPLPGRWDIELSHTPGGAKKFVAIGNADRDRQFSIVVDGKIVQSYAFPPMQKDIYADGTSAGAFPKEVAEQLLQRMRAAITACAKR